MNDQPRRVVITGMGVVAANGSTLPEFWNSICLGQSAAKRVTRFDVSNLPNKIAAEISDFDAAQYMDFKLGRRLDLSLQFSVAASLRAAEDAQLHCASIDPDRIGVVEGTSVSNNEMAFKSEAAYTKKGYRGLSPFTLINGYCGSGSGEIAHHLKARGHAITCSSGSASGNDAIGYALRMIQEDEVDVMIAGGAEAPLLAPLWGAFCLTKVMTSRNDTPQEAMRPFDESHDGFLLGEGGAFLILEELTHALGRGARIYAEVLGHGRSCEAFHPVAPHPEGVGIRRAMEKAFRNARVHPSEVQYVNAHGTATDLSDAVECKSIKHVFGSHSSSVAVSSTKPVTGHLLAAAGAIETVVCALAIHHQKIPLTVNFKKPASDCDLDFVAGESRPYPVEIAVNLNTGFGGKNACLILGRFHPTR